MQVNELFLSVQGEGQDSGFPCTFVRFTGCNIRCTYCDTAYAFYEGDEASIDEVMGRIEALGAERVCLTGGEPMLQPDLPELMDRLLATGKRVILETGGVIDLEKVPNAVVKVVDIKTPEALPYDKGEAGPRFTKRHFHYPNLELLTDHDQVKFVICSRKDYEWVKSFIEAHDLAERVGTVLLSPVNPGLTAKELVEWMLEDKLRARLNLQLHKYIWGSDVRGV